MQERRRKRRAKKKKKKIIPIIIIIIIIVVVVVVAIGILLDQYGYRSHDSRQEVSVDTVKCSQTHIRNQSAVFKSRSRWRNLNKHGLKFVRERTDFANLRMLKMIQGLL